MRVAYLFEPNDTELDPFLTLLPWWAKGLAESQNEILIVTNTQAAKKLGSPHPNVRTAAAVERWSWLSAGKIATALLSFAPQVVHAIVGRPPRWTSPWPALEIFRTQNIPVVVTPGEGVELMGDWPFASRQLGPDFSESLGLPKDFSSPSSSPTRSSQVFIPGPLLSHRNAERTLQELEIAISAYPHLNFHLGWDWSELKVADRLLWRPRLEGRLSAGQVLSTNPSQPTTQFEVLLSSSHVILSVLKLQSWWRPILRGAAQGTSAHFIEVEDWSKALSPTSSPSAPSSYPRAEDQTINRLARVYQQLLA